MAKESVVLGIHAVEAALDRGAVELIWADGARQDRRMQGLLGKAAAQGVEVQMVPRAELDRRAGGERHQGVVAKVHAASAKGEGYLEELLTMLDRPPFLLVLDGVQDPHNLGACLRTADAAGVHAVVAPKDRACGLNATVRKVASGAAETVPFVQVTNLARTLRMLSHAGVWLVGTALENADSEIYQTDLTGRLALVLGAEGQGLRRLTREHCDRLVYIPMQGTVQSLNVSVAAGVCLFEAVRQRRKAGRL